MGTYRLRVPASRVVYVPDAQGGLPPGPTYCTYGVHVPASGVGYVPGTLAPQVRARARRAGGGGLALRSARGDARVHRAHAQAARAAQAAPRGPARVADAPAVGLAAGELASEAAGRQHVRCCCDESEARRPPVTSRRPETHSFQEGLSKSFVPAFPPSWTPPHAPSSFALRRSSPACEGRCSARSASAPLMCTRCASRDCHGRGGEGVARERGLFT